MYSFFRGEEEVGEGVDADEVEENDGGIEAEPPSGLSTTHLEPGELALLYDLCDDRGTREHSPSFPVGEIERKREHDFREEENNDDGKGAEE